VFTLRFDDGFNNSCGISAAVTPNHEMISGVAACESGEILMQHGPEIKVGAEPGAVGAAARVVGGIAVRKARLHPCGTNGVRPRGRPFYATQSGLFPRTLRNTEEDPEA
jgi:hypothetical protein